MACEDHDIPADTKPCVNVGLDSDPSHSDILADTKGEIEEHDFLKRTKVEHSTFTSGTKSHQSALIKIENNEYSEFECQYNKEEQNMTWKEGISCNRNTKNNLQVEHGTFTSDTITFQSTTIKTEEHDTFSEFETKYNKEEQYMTWEEGTSCSINTKNNLIGGDIGDPRSSSELKYEEVDLGVIKMEEDEDTRSESTEEEDREGSKQNPAHKIGHAKYGEKCEKTFDCKKCGREFSRKNKLDNHIVARHSDNGEMMNTVTSKIHCCKHCKYITVYASSLSKHMRTHGEKLEEIFDCTKCEKKFSSKFSLDGHIIALHSCDVEMINSVTNKIHRCKHCSYITVRRDDIAKHMRTHGEKLEKTFDCLKCRKEFSSKFNLDGHIVSHHSNNDEMINSVTSTIHRCKHCRYITIPKKHLIRHMRTHGEILEETFYCIQCKKEFSRKDRLDDHIVTQHSNDDEMMNSVTSKIHRCKHCCYTTVQTDYFNRHLRTHGERPEKTFGCMKCEKEFSSKRSLDGHILALHSSDAEMMKGVTQKIHRCKHCRYITVRRDDIAKHMRTHENEEGNV